MLIQFNFKNFRSFKNETSFDMTASSIKEHLDNVIDCSKNGNYLKVAAIYGANASGKSNIIDAFYFMRKFVINSLISGNEEKENENFKPILVQNFHFDNITKNQPSEFEVFFLLNNVEYQYGFILDNKIIYKEWLYSRTSNNKKYNTLFERNYDDVECGKDMKDAEKFKYSIEKRTLFLTLTAKTKINVSKIVYDWFLTTDIIDFGNAVFEAIISRRLSPRISENKYKKKVEEFLNAIDSGIKGIRIEKVKDSKKYRFYAIHQTNNDNETAEIPFEEESSGTIKMFCLFDYFLETIKNGRTLFIDELNAKLHPLLLRYIINMFHDPRLNKNNAQLIYTTHDAFTLTKDIFRRDEIWFTSKDEYGVSNLYSLVEYKTDKNNKIRNDASYNKNYLSGRYGAIPILKEFNILEDNDEK